MLTTNSTEQEDIMTKSDIRIAREELAYAKTMNDRHPTPYTIRRFLKAQREAAKFEPRK